MLEPLYNKNILKKRGLITNGFCLPYNPKLVGRANELRKSMTPVEKKLWMRLLRNFPFKVMRQKPIDNYIVDFYCAKLNLVVEVDGCVHDTEKKLTLSLKGNRLGVAGINKMGRDSISRI